LVARIWVSETNEGAAWHVGSTIDLPAHAVRHVQVLRMQPGDAVALFNGKGRLWLAELLHMSRREASVRLESFSDSSCELPVGVTLAVGMPANDRMDALVEKATELGVSAIQPLVCTRSVLRLDGERALKKVAHWQAVAVAACEQSGRTHLPMVHSIQSLSHWLSVSASQEASLNMHAAVLSFAPKQSAFGWLKDKIEVDRSMNQRQPFVFLSGPEGGLTPEEEALAVQLGYQPIGLGPRVLRADTAPLMALSLAAALSEHGICDA
jgi:16S rRNA (uracil1498-N3)-methyltransferase